MPLHGVGRELLAEGQFNERPIRPTSEEGPPGCKQDRDMSDQDSDHGAILCEDTVGCETDSEGETRISSIVDRPIAETGKFNNSGSDGY